VQDIAIFSGRPAIVHRAGGSGHLTLMFEGLRESRTSSRACAVTLPLTEAERLRDLLAEQLRG